MAARGTREILLHLGIAGALAGELRGASHCLGDGAQDDPPAAEPAATEPPDLGTAANLKSLNFSMATRKGAP